MTVEFIIKELNNIKSSSTDKNNEIKFLNKEFNMILEKALEMEKKQSLSMSDYNLEELAKEFAIQQLADPKEYDTSIYAATIKNTYMVGFQKALELLTFKSE